MSSIRKWSLGEEKRFSNRSSALPSLNGKTVMQLMVIFFFSLAGNNTVLFVCLIPEASGRMHVLLMLESHFADGLCTLESLSGQGCVQACWRLLQASRCGWASAAVVCFWLQFHTSWQTICVKSTADSGCELHRGRGQGGLGGAKQANPARGLTAGSTEHLKDKRIFKWGL